MDSLEPFYAGFFFSDGVSASVCGLCAGRREEALRAVYRLSALAFQPPEEGLLIDARFARLLREAFRGLPVPLAGGCVRAAARDGPCGAVIGDPSAGAEPLREERRGLSLAGRKGFLLLRPGVGALALFPLSDRERETERAAWEAFPDADQLAALERGSAGGLWVLDHDPRAPAARDCRAWWNAAC